MGDKFENILVPRNTQFGIFKFMSRTWYPQKVFETNQRCSPQELKNIVSQSSYIDAVIDAESKSSGKSKEELRHEVLQYLDEIGYDKKMHIIRWMGIFFLKVSFMMKVGIFVNESPIKKLKSSMGSNPVLFLPTHRSYADFCLLTYLCYHYDIDLPVVAAGTDFYSMAVVGRSMRETGAFYIRRTMTGAPLYAATLRQYVRSLLNTCTAPVEFFLEGTRSRSNKCMAPKYGMLSMMLTPLFAGEVNDITVVPVNISYDRLMEHVLFAYEHLGVPKPKESTGKLIKALRSLNDHFGNIYINMGEPLSVKQYLRTIQNNTKLYSPKTLKPIDLHNITSSQFNQVQDVANYVISLQQQNTVVTIANLLSIVLMQSLVFNTLLSYEEVISELEWMIKVLLGLGAKVFEKDVRSSVDQIMIVHKNMMRFDSERKLRLVSTPLMKITDEVQAKMKGHTLKAETIVNAVPIIELQLYVNPLLHYLVPPAIVALIVHKKSPNREQLSIEYSYIRKLLKYEFFYMENAEENTFNIAVEYCVQHDVINIENDWCMRKGDSKLARLLLWIAHPVLTTVYISATVLRELESCNHKEALKKIQERVESSNCHPYCLSLDSISTCLQGLVAVGGIIKGKGSLDALYKSIPNVLDNCIELLRSIMPELQLNFGKTNNVMVDNAKIIAKL